MDSQREAPAASASFHSLPSDLITRVAQLGFLQHLSPFYDRADLLNQACLLACVGNSGCTALARELFAALSPRLGAQLPGNVNESSSAKQLKAALKEWGLPLSGNKGELWQRLMDEVQDSEEGEDGQAPRHCIVSGATRRELSGSRHWRISANQAKTKAGVSEWHLQRRGAQHRMEAGSRGVPIKTYLASDVKQVALEVFGSWDKYQRQKQDSKNEWEQIKQREEAKQNARREELRRTLAARGHSQDQVEAMMNTRGVASCIWGTREKLEMGAAADWMERAHFCVSQVPNSLLAFMAIDQWEPPRGMAQYKAEEERWNRALAYALRWYASGTRDVEELRRSAAIPPSLLPELERLWRQEHPTVA